MFIYNVIQFYKDYNDLTVEDHDSFMNVFSFATLSQAEKFASIARKTQKEDNSRYMIEISNLGSVNEAVDFLDKVNGRTDGL